MRRTSTTIALSTTIIAKRPSAVVAVAVRVPLTAMCASRMAEPVSRSVTVPRSDRCASAGVPHRAVSRTAPMTGRIVFTSPPWLWSGGEWARRGADVASATAGGHTPPQTSGASRYEIALGGGGPVDDGPDHWCDRRLWRARHEGALMDCDGATLTGRTQCPGAVCVLYHASAVP